MKEILKMEILIVKDIIFSIMEMFLKEYVFNNKLNIFDEKYYIFF